MKVRYTLFIALGFILLFFHTSCTKAKESKFEQTWELIDISNSLPEGKIELWDFYDGTFNRIRYAETTGSDTIDKGTYTVNAGPFKTTVTIKDCSDNDYNSEWKINKLNRDLLVMFCKKEGVFLYKEFEKF